MILWAEKCTVFALKFAVSRDFLRNLQCLVRTFLRTFNLQCLVNLAKIYSDWCGRFANFFGQKTE